MNLFTFNDKAKTSLRYFFRTITKKQQLQQQHKKGNDLNTYHQMSLYYVSKLSNMFKCLSFSFILYQQTKKLFMGSFSLRTYRSFLYTILLKMFHFYYLVLRLRR